MSKDPLFQLLMKTTTIKQTVTFPAPPEKIYHLIMDQKKHAKLVDSEARISRQVGGKFVIYGGDVDGKNLELVPDQKIVQTWRYSDWPAGSRRAQSVNRRQA